MDEEFNKYRSEVDFTLYLENTKIADFEYRFDELIKFMQQWKTNYPIDEDIQIGTEKALEVIWHPITRPYTVYARFLPETLKDSGEIIRDPKKTFEFMSVNWFQVGDRLKLIFTHERWLFVFPPLFDILGAIGKDWQETRRDIENYHIVLTGQPFPIDTAQADAESLTSYQENLSLVCDKREFRTWFERQYPSYAKYYKDTPEGATFNISLTRFHLAFNNDNGKHQYTFTITEQKGFSKIRQDFIGTIRNTFGLPMQQVGAMVLPKIEDPTDQRIWEYIQKDPSITDTALAQKLGNTSRQAVNTRRRGLEKMGYQVRVSRQNQ